MLIGKRADEGTVLRFTNQFSKFTSQNAAVAGGVLKAKVKGKMKAGSELLIFNF